ncbi:glycoside hydrolase family 2 protein [Flavobacterium circumlabens]|uniref:Beta-galactosidase n=1 Tax=Flavobacterium circumlabens TaxID=2133765 RepID=A0A4Y7UG38_9FLAO|nr:beta-galactosidase GalA [Flavobacterium circumlabens]TCN59527.1 beta-galactosidase [Flavobacterium circumlabens]TEB44819.1 glycoside hydrolase family 2 protein [Flavobacterium circumlabens]
MKLIITFVFSVLSLTGFAQQNSSLNYREKLSLDKGWRFHLGDIPFPEVKGHLESYFNAKAGKAGGAAATDYDDTNWRILNLPHDWAIEGRIDSTANLAQGYRKRGIGWYRRSFKIDPKDRGKNLELQFDGIATHCTVWLNGNVVHRNWSGYTSFYIDMTDMAKYGDELNVISIRVDAVDQEGWWYEGAGIYRHSWLVKRSPLHIITDGVFANPVKKNASEWEIPVEITLQNSRDFSSDAVIYAALLDAKGNKIADSETSIKAAAMDKTIANLSVKVNNPQLWSVDQPTLYKVQTVLKEKGQVIDTLTTTCGFRTIRFTADSGFYLNDKPMKLQGVCNHQDHAGVGVAVPNSLWDFRLKKLKEMGANAYRCAHNPPSAEFLNACDRLGILVMDENRNFNSSPEYISQLTWMVRRDRNHPSIILWSVFNEEPMQGTEIGYRMVKRMSAEVKKLDTTRPVTAAANGGLFEPVNVSQAVDVVGFNYQMNNYDRFHQEHPNMILTSSEDASAYMIRGNYTTDLAKHTLDAYDTQKASWGATHRETWKTIAERPYLLGCFIWTGFDYHGEPSPFDWPTAGSNFGTLDLCGFPKTAFYIHQAQWIKDKPILQVVPHWNWEHAEGTPIKVMAMSNAEKVKLVLNGKVVGEQKVDKYEMNTWEVPYRAGKLEAVGYTNGKEVSHFTIETTGKPTQIRLTPDRNRINGDGWDAVPVTVEVLDSKGRPVQTANLPIEFELEGPADIIGLGNGDPNSHEMEKGNKRSLFNGLAQVILQSKEGGNGKLNLKASSPGLKSAMLSIEIQPTEDIPSVEVIKPYLLLDKWLLSPISKVKPDPNKEIEGNDMNSWQPVPAGQSRTFSDGSFAVFRSSFTPYLAQQESGGKIMFKNLKGKAEIWLDKKLLAVKKEEAQNDFSVQIPAGKGKRELSVLIETIPGNTAGLGGLVIIE